MEFIVSADFLRSLEKGETMTTKERLLELFEANKGVYFSGEEIAGKLQMSRAAVWKAVKSLRNEGYQIDAVTNKGYCLAVETDILSPQGIQKYLNLENGHLDIVVVPVTSSTNILVKEKAGQGGAEGFTVIANEQTAGRGRRGRTFFSPCGTGLYMSILLRPANYSASQAVRITTMAAVAVCESIEEVSDVKAEIKWVNDIFIDGKKVCGILTEGSFDLESGMLDYAVLGVGINVYQPSGEVPEELKAIVGSVFEKPQNDMKNRLAAAFLNRFMGYYHAQNYADYIEKYRSRSLAVGRQVQVISANQTREAFAYGVNDECELLVRYEDGTCESLSSGEISIRV